MGKHSGFKAAGGFVGAKMSWNDLDTARKSLRRGDGTGGKPDHATQWHNRRPICPYGCDEEGQLKEIIMKDGKALGIYQDSEGLVFTADLQMAPKPTGRKLTVGPDGQYQMVEETTQNES